MLLFNEACRTDFFGNDSILWIFKISKGRKNAVAIFRDIQQEDQVVCKSKQVKLSFQRLSPYGSSMK